MAWTWPQPGVVIGGFTLRSRLAEGADAVLWRVACEGETAPLLMRIPRLRPGTNAVALVGFQVEQAVLARLASPHAPRIVAAGEDDGRPWIVVEELPGASLRSRLAALTHAFDEIARAGRAIATALADVHRQGVIHLGLCPATIRFLPDGRAALVGFGNARHLALPDPLGEQFAVPLGNRATMAPEQVRGVRSDPRSDLYALGAILYRLATGRDPFGEPDSLAGLERRLYRDPQPPRALVSACPPWLQEVILRCLEVDPGRRHQTAAEIATLLADPGRIACTAYAARGSRDDLLTVLRRRLALRRTPAFRGPPAQGAAGAPLVLVAVDAGAGDAELEGALLRAARTAARSLPQTRLACVSVRQTTPAALDATVDATGQCRHGRRLLELRHWARPLDLPSRRISFHVLEAPDPAAALLGFSRANPVVRVIVGARGSSSLRRLLGSTSSRLVAEAPCPVLVVRPPRR